VNWEARYKGMVKKVEELTLSSKATQEQLAAKTSDIERLEAELGLKETEKSVAVSERDKQLNEIVQSNQSLTSELERLRALELKVKVANEIGSPEMLAIVDSIPNVSDEEALTSLMKNISDWGNEKVKARETELLAGVTPDITATPAQVEVPQSNEDWQEYVNQAEFNTPEREQRMNAWRDWGLSLQQQ
jgi:uncharacterized small protein (DUF1192 family)